MTDEDEFVFELHWRSNVRDIIVAHGLEYALSLLRKDELVKVACDLGLKGLNMQRSVNQLLEHIVARKDYVGSGVRHDIHIGLDKQQLAARCTVKKLKKWLREQGCRFKGSARKAYYVDLVYDKLRA